MPWRSTWFRSRKEVVNAWARSEPSLFPRVNYFGHEISRLTWLRVSSLAKAELYLTLATVFRRYDMELYDAVRERDIDIVSDGFLPQPSTDARPLRVLIRK